MTTLRPWPLFVAGFTSACSVGARGPEAPAPRLQPRTAARATAPEPSSASARAKTEQALDAAKPSPARPPVDDALLDARRFLLMDQPPRCPEEMSLVAGRVCVDRWEASLVEVLGDGRERPWSPFTTPDESRVRVRAVSAPGVMPQGYVSGELAARACEASGKRLCTADEWESACRGPKGSTYPYGSRRRKHTCNDDGRPTHPVAEVTRELGLPRDRMWYEGMGHPLINQLEDTLQRTGERDQCTNGYGVFDMVGNLHEWIDDPDGTFRGGFYMDTLANGEGCTYATTAHPSSYHDYSTGFRCCLDAEPVE